MHEPIFRRSLKCLLVGDGSLLIQCGSVLVSRGHTIAGVVTGTATISAWARENGAPVFEPGQTLSDSLNGATFDWLFSIANLSLIPSAVWRSATCGAANFHDGPLPRYAGLNAPAWALLAGETNYGTTWHAISDGVDEGDIYVRSNFDIDDHETALSLNTKCFEAGMTSFAELLDAIESGTLEGIAQDLSQRTYFGRHDRPVAAGTLDFTASTHEVERLFRALSFGQGYVNPVALPKIRLGQNVYRVLELQKVETTVSAPAGTVLSSDRSGAVIATQDGAVRIGALSDLNGASIDIADVLPAGSFIDRLSEQQLGELSSFTAQTAKHEAWFWRSLQAGRAPELFGARPRTEDLRPDVRSFPLPSLSGFTVRSAIAAIAGFFIRSGTGSPLRLGVVNDRCAEDARALPGYVAPVLPLVLDVQADVTVHGLVELVTARIAHLEDRRGHTSDLILRNTQSSVEPFTIAACATGETSQPVPGALATFVLSAGVSAASLEIDTARLPVVDCEQLLMRLDRFFHAFSIDDAKRISDLPIMSQAEERATLYECNETEIAFDRSKLIHGLIEEQSARTPDAVAVVCEDRSLTYLELERASKRVANRLAAQGVGPDKLVGLYLNRSCELVVGALAILKAGGAYVPLDPTYPAERIAYMIEESGLQLVLSSRGLTPPALAPGVEIVEIEDAMDSGQSGRPLSAVAADNLAYVIYTSGSTGRPKGVMVEHRNVVNFFAGMDRRVPRSSAGQDVWLAVTSLSFDISVLELFWTLSHGFKVVIQTDGRRAATTSKAKSKRKGATDFSLFFWGNDDDACPQKYDLLLEGARFADAHGFRAIWTPERHFHAFGGPYPNPSVTGAAVAAITTNLDVRAGSCVLPLHHPARVAEEWAVVDNLCNGRAGLAFASGWMPEDFLLRPENAPPDNKAAMLRDVETVRRLWRGEAVTFVAPGGKDLTIVTQPRPVSKELPVWITTAGNLETFREAARAGANVLTHLLGQSIAEVGKSIALYRKTLADTGRNPDDYTVTLMLHTLIGEDREQVREIAREPMKAYLRSAVALIKQYAWAFPAFKRPAGTLNALDVDLQSLDPEEIDAIIEFAFLRYFEDSGLFGTVDDALRRVAEVKAIGVDEIACLIDFGVPSAVAKANLWSLAEVVASASEGEFAAADADFGMGRLIRSHGVTHLQFTPSMAAMLLIDEDARQALGSVRHLFIGGEALHASLVRELRSVTAATIENMYGPTETTIWSSTRPVDGHDAGIVPIGTPIANTQLYILDSALRPVPPGQPGELFIGGDGVTRGYLNRPELTSERFLQNPFTDSGRMYRTGDLVRRDASSEIQFIGRVDHQVKVRGYRIELGEIEAHLSAHPSVAEAVVVVRESGSNDVRIVAYLRLNGADASEDAMRDHLRQKLPEFMMPAHFVFLERFPLTPNAKIDRSRLPPPPSVRPPAMANGPVAEPVLSATAGDAARTIAEAFKRVLGVENVGMNDNFFDFGGHSLLAVQVHRDLKSNLAKDLTITDLYRFPTAAGLAAHLSNRSGTATNLSKVADRAAARRNAIATRFGRRST